MNQVDSIGIYKGTVLEGGITLSKSKYPQWVARFKATHKYVETPEEIAHFKLTEAGWVDWEYDESIVAFLVLFKANAEAGEPCVPGENDFLNYQQLKTALGWDGTEFDALCGDAVVGKALQFRVEENTYNNKTTLQVSWVDNVDADPVRQLRSLAPEDVKGLNKLLKVAKATTPAKPATAPKPASCPVSKPTPPPAAPPSKPEAAKPESKPPAKKKAKAVEPPAPEAADFPETTQQDAWKAVLAGKGEAGDAAVEEAWIEACNEVGGGRDDETFTGLEWAKVREVTIAALSKKG